MANIPPSTVKHECQIKFGSGARAHEQKNGEMEALSASDIDIDVKK